MNQSDTVIRTEDELALGSRVAIDARLERELEYVDGNFGMANKLWKRHMLVNPQLGILVGYRTLSNGRISYDREYGNSYKGVDYFKAALVTTSLKTKPFFARLDDVKESPL